jgi:hypothetical protein
MARPIPRQFPRPPPAQPKCRCGDRNPSHGIGPPAVPEQQWWCGACIQFQPAHQAALAREAREALGDEGELPC